MESLRNLYRIGRGPSSSHTMGPSSASEKFKAEYPNADSFIAQLYGSLAKTGKGHLTDLAIEESFAPISCKVIFSDEIKDLEHPNTMELTALKKGEQIGFWKIHSVGGGKINIEGMEQETQRHIYPHKTFSDMRLYCEKEDIRLWEYVQRVEGASIYGYLHKVWGQMKKTLEHGLVTDGILPGGLEVHRKAKHLYRHESQSETAQTKENRVVCAYAFAVSEENAAAGTVVTAPTCGAAGVLPAVLYYRYVNESYTDDDIVRALACAGVIGNLLKTNASISGAECGCQAEIGSACSMAAAALGELHGMKLSQIEYAAEVAMEHHLGLTCDPIHGLVQIPCIERNAVAAMRAINAFNLAGFLSETRKISFDLVVKTMYETGCDLFSKYRETSEGGLAKLYPIHIEETFEDSKNE